MDRKGSVSIGVVWQARKGWVGSGWASHGKVWTSWQAWRGVERIVLAGIGMAMYGRQGEAWLCVVRLGKVGYGYFNNF